MNTSTNINTFSEQDGEKHICFSLGKEYYAIPLISVKEVIGIPVITPVPYTPSYFLGIMNLRGQVISVIDLRKKINITADISQETSIIICDFDGVTLGIVVDSINFVLNPNAEDLSATPMIQSAVNVEYIKCIYRKDNTFILFLNIMKLLNVEDLLAVKKVKEN